MRVNEIGTVSDLLVISLVHALTQSLSGKRHPKLLELSVSD